MTHTLDLLLETAREPEPSDDAFVQLVMAGVQDIDARRVGRRWMRRPMVIGISAAIVVCGGAVAAVVGTNPSPEKEAAATKRPAAVAVSAAPEAEIVGAEPATRASKANDVAAPASTSTPVGAGYATDHTSFVVDEKTGVLLRTETYTNVFEVGKAQRVTLTLENTGAYPVAFTASDGCGLQVMASGARNGNVTSDSSLLGGDDALFEWVCAGSDDDPRDGEGQTTWVLGVGERKTADAFLTLPEAGAWKISGICRCEYRQVKPTPAPRKDLMSKLGAETLNAPLLPEPSDGKNLVTPVIGVRAD